MARTVLTQQVPTRAGTDITAVTGSDSTNGLQFPNNGKSHFIVKTGATGETGTFTVTLSAVNVDGGTQPVRTYTFAANKEIIVGPFDTAIYGTTLLVNHAQTTTNVIPVVVS